MFTPNPTLTRVLVDDRRRALVAAADRRHVRHVRHVLKRQQRTRHET